MLDKISKFKIDNARIASFDGEIKIRLEETGFAEILFQDGEIKSLTELNGRKLSRGMIVRVASRYTGNVVAIIIGFSFSGENAPVVISEGGAKGELQTCVYVNEITLFPEREDINYRIKGVFED